MIFLCLFSFRVFSSLLAGLHYTIVPTRVDLLTKGAQVLYTSSPVWLRFSFQPGKKKEHFFSNLKTINLFLKSLEEPSRQEALGLWVSCLVSLLLSLYPSALSLLEVMFSPLGLTASCPLPGTSGLCVEVVLKPSTKASYPLGSKSPCQQTPCVPRYPQTLGLSLICSARMWRYWAPWELDSRPNSWELQKPVGSSLWVQKCGKDRGLLRAMSLFSPHSEICHVILFPCNSVLFPVST